MDLKELLNAEKLSNQVYSCVPIAERQSHRTNQSTFSVVL